MDNKIQELTDKIYQEGVEKGNAEAARIVEEAKVQEQKILDTARKEADRVIAEAKRSAEELKQNTEAELRLFARQSVEALKSEITDLLTDKLVSSAVVSAIDDAAFMRQMMLTIAQEWAKNGDLAIRTADADALTRYFEQKASALLEKTVRIEQVNGLPASFEIVPSGGSFKISFGKEEFINYFKEFLRPQLVRLLF